MGLRQLQSKKQMIIVGNNVEEESKIKEDLDMSSTEKWEMPLWLRIHEVQGKNVKNIDFCT